VIPFKRMTLLAAAALALAALAGCGMDADKGILMAAGAYGDLAVIVSDESARPAVNVFLGTFNPEKTFVIKPEPTFAADVYEDKRWELAKGYKNALFIVRIGDGSRAESQARKVVSDEAWRQLSSGGGGIVQVKDAWSTYQLLVVVAARDVNGLASILRNNADKLRDIYESSNRERILRRNRYEGLQSDLMSRYWDRHGFFLEIPGAFRENQYRPKGFDGIELMRNGPSRGLTVSWQAEADPVGRLGDRALLTAMRDSLGARLHNEEILPETLVWSEAEIGGVACVRLEGAWNSLEFTGGGPFWCYFIPDHKSGRLFCLDLLVYAPGQDKMNHFRNLDAVASTFSTRRPQP
jgi:hypothetical protein